MDALRGHLSEHHSKQASVLCTDLDSMSAKRIATAGLASVW